MRINTQFPVAVHILAVLAYFEDEAVTSEVLARSVGTNPVVVRRLISGLKKAGLVSAQAGVKGITLCRKPEHITLLDVYHAVHPEEESIFDLHQNPSQRCVVGAHIVDAVNEPFKRAQKAMEMELGTSTMADVLLPIQKANGLIRD